MGSHANRISLFVFLALILVVCLFVCLCFGSNIYTAGLFLIIE